MQALCSECKKTYIEYKEEKFVLIGQVPMICYECLRKYQPERSKREDYVEYTEWEISQFIRDYLLMNENSPIKCNLEKLGEVIHEEISRCVALNNMEKY